ERGWIERALAHLGSRTLERNQHRIAAAEAVEEFLEALHRGMVGPEDGFGTDRQLIVKRRAAGGREGRQREEQRQPRMTDAERSEAVHDGTASLPSASLASSVKGRRIERDESRGVRPLAFAYVW